MIRDSERLRELERRWASDVVDDRTFIEALDIYASLWRHALSLDPDPLADWRDDVKANLAVARGVNGLPVVD